MAAIAPDPSAALRTIRALRDERFDVVHLHEPLAPGPPQTALVFASSPMVGTFHRAGESFWYRAFRGLSSWALSHLSVRVAVSEEARAAVARVTGGTFELLWNGIDVRVYADMLPWPAPPSTILFLGRHEPRKGLAVLIEALEYLPADVHLWVASEGPETPRLRQATLGNDRIEWLGMISEQEKVRRIRGASVLCVPSVHGESFGVILLEGMAAGTPVVATDLPGYRNVARPDQEALLAPPGDPKGLACALATALEGGPKVEALVESGIHRAASFSLESLAKRYLDLYEEARRGR
jgi:phosphatidyl-myo-inositol alpha-mannosyltransferase